MSKFTQTFRCSVLVAFFFTLKAQSVSPHFSQLKGIDLASPMCDGSRDLDVANDYFVEIANSLPGRDEYNALIQLREKKDWTRLDTQIDIFRRAYESTPLVEAVAFLALQSKFDQVETPNPEKIKEVEKELRQTLLLYPKSTLVPVIIVNAAAFNIRMGAYQKALSLFESVKHDYPFHALQCHVQAGIGESAFLLHEFPTAKNAFDLVIQKCTDRLAKLHAEIRLADLKVEKKPAEALKVYEENTSKYPLLIGRVAPWTYFNTGELKYLRDQYPSAKFYFNEFLRYGAKDFACAPWALKRLADVSQKTKQPMNVVVGNYLVLNDRAPLADIGRYGKLHAHLLELNKVSEAEADRRLKIFDEAVDKIHSDEIRTLLFLEKGLAALSIGEKSAIPYLLHLSERKTEILKKKEVMDYIRKNILLVLKSESSKISEKKISKEEKKDKLLLEPLEDAYKVWLQGTPEEKEAQTLYRSLLLNRFDDLLDSEDPSLALQKLQRWNKSGLWPQKGDPEGAVQLATILLRFLHDCPDTERRGFARAILDKKEILEPFIYDSTKAVWVALYLAEDNLSKVKEILSPSNARGIASIDRTVKKEARSYLALAIGKGYRAIKRYSEAEAFLEKVQDPEIVSEAHRELIALYGETGKVAKQTEMVTHLIPTIAKNEVPEILKSLEKGMAAKKQWGGARSVYQAAEKAHYSKTDMAPFYAFLGRASYETSRWKDAIDEYETAITIKKEYEKSAELKFQLAKSYLKAKEKAKARKLWEEVVAFKDPFWSSLAVNELHLLEPK